MPRRRASGDRPRPLREGRRGRRRGRVLLRRRDGDHRRAARGLRRRPLRATIARRCPRPPSWPSLGCGNPTAVAELHEGETVLDLGSGGGIDVLLSARRVGPTGKAYGLDMTDEMLELARDNQRRGRGRERRVPQGHDRGRSRCPTTRSTSSSPTASSTSPATSRRSSARPRGCCGPAAASRSPTWSPTRTWTRRRARDMAAVDRLHRRRAHPRASSGRELEAAGLRGRRDPRDPPRPRARCLGDHPRPRRPGDPGRDPAQRRTHRENVLA